MRKTDSQVIKEALKAVRLTVDVTVSQVDFTSATLRATMLEFAEQGAWLQYEGSGFFDGTHIDDMSDRLISKI